MHSRINLLARRIHDAIPAIAINRRAFYGDDALKYPCSPQNRLLKEICRREDHIHYSQLNSLLGFELLVLTH